MAEQTDSPQEVRSGTLVTKAKAEIATGVSGGVSQLNKFLLDASTRDGDPDLDPMDGIIRQVLSASSPAAVLTPTEVRQGQDMVGVPLMLVDFELHQSEFDAGSPFYATMAVLIPPGEPDVVNCGHKKVLAQLVKLKEFGEFPYKVVFINRGTSKQGTPMLELTSWKDDDFEDEPPF